VVETPRVLVVTNDFPPRVGGAQQYIWNLTAHLPPDRVSVLAPNQPGWREHDAAQAFPVHRWPAEALWPTSGLARRAVSLAGEHRADVVLFGHGLLPLIGGALSARGLPYAVITHGWEVWLARTPGVASAMRRGLEAAGEVASVSRSTGRAIRRALGLSRLPTVLYPGVDEKRFAPSVDGSEVRERFGLGDRPVVTCVSRLVARKGQDTLIRAIGDVRRLAPGAALLLVGDGSSRRDLQVLASAAPPGSVVFAGEVSDEDLPAFYAAGDLFAMPCRSRWAGLEVEGFGIVYLEAAAAGRATLAGRSGGADEAIIDGETGLLVAGREPKAVALAMSGLLTDAARLARFGAVGRARVEAEFTLERRAEALAELLSRAAG
jgi:phosphatidylinositol alpha-1,6-mannosyltransferase